MITDLAIPAHYLSLREIVTMRRMLLSVAGALFAMITLTACESSSPPRPMETIEDTVEASATVESVDVLNRLMTIKTEAGDLVTLEVGPEVQNLVQVRQGDRVVVRYREAIGARISNDAAGQPVSIDVDTDRARLGQRRRPGRRRPPMFR